jgi:hypothetical protein
MACTLNTHDNARTCATAVTPVVNEKEKKKKKEVLSPRQFSMVVKFLLVDGGRVADVGADIETDVEGEVPAILLPPALSLSLVPGAAHVSPLLWDSGARVAAFGAYDRPQVPPHTSGTASQFWCAVAWLRLAWLTGGVLASSRCAVTASRVLRCSDSWRAAHHIAPVATDPIALPVCTLPLLPLSQRAFASGALSWLTWRCRAIPSADFVVWDEESKLCAIALPSSIRVFALTCVHIRIPLCPFACDDCSPWTVYPTSSAARSKRTGWQRLCARSIEWCPPCGPTRACSSPPTDRFAVVRPS